jgi:hypothetical protein
MVTVKDAIFFIAPDHVAGHVEAGFAHVYDKRVCDTEYSDFARN